MRDPSSAEQPHDEPGEATAAAGAVILDGPAGVAVTFTPEAAEATARSLLDAVEVARRDGERSETAGDD